MQIQMSNLEDNVQKMTSKCSEEIGHQLKGQLGKWNDVINQGVHRKIQQSMDNIIKLTTNEVLKTSEGK